MTVQSTTNRVQSNTDGVTTDFPFNYPLFADTDLVVTLTDLTTGVSTVQVLNTDYTLVGTQDQFDAYPDGATVVFPSAPADGSRVTRERIMSATQSTDLVDGDPLPADSVERMSDKLTLLFQYLLDLFSRAIIAPSTDTVSLGTLPSDTTRANKALIFSSTGALAVSTDDYEDQAVATAASAAAAAASATSAQDSAASAGTSAGNAAGSATAAASSAVAAASSAASLSSSLQEFYPETYGSGNSDVEIQAAIDAAEAAGRGVVKLGPKTYTLNAGLTIHGTVGLIGSGRQITILNASGLNGTPAIQVGDVGISPLMPRIEGLWIDAPNNAPVIKALGANRLVLHDLYLDGFHTGIQLGDGDEAEFCTEVTINDVEGAVGYTPHGHGIEVRGATAILSNVRLEGWAIGTGNQTTGKAGVYLSANAGNRATDGLRMVNCGLGLWPTGFKIENGAFTTFVVQMDNCFIDRCYDDGILAILPAAATLSIFKVSNCHIQGGSGIGDGSGIFFNCDPASSVGIIQFSNNHVSGFNQYGAAFEGTMKNVTFTGNVLTNVGTGAGYDAVSIDNGVEGAFTGNKVDAPCRYGWNLGNSLNLNVSDNPTQGPLTGKVFTSSGIAGPNRIVERNGDGRKKVVYLGPFTMANVPASANNALRMHTGYLGTGTDAAARVRPGFRGFVSRLVVTSNASSVAGSITLKVNINGTPGTLTATLNAGASSVNVNQDSGDFFIDTDLVGIDLTSTSDLSPTTVDAVGFLELTEY